MNEEKKKTNNKGLITILILLVIGLTSYIVYDKILKDKYFNNNEKVINNSIDETDKAEAKESNTEKELNVDELYAKYLKKLESELDNKFKSDNLNDDENKDANEYGQFRICNATAWNDTSYCVLLNGKQLIVESDTSNKISVDKNVLQMFLIEEGQAGGHTLYYIKNDGKVYKVDIEKVIDDNTSVEIKEISSLKNIVDIKTELHGFMSGASTPVFIDIDGNINRLN